MPPPRYLRAGVIGLGVGARHAAIYQAHARCTLGTICDIDEQRLQEVGAQHPDCRLTTDAADILSDPLIDVVSIASYDTHHGEQVLAAVNAGKHVFVEKPLCLTDREFEKIDAALCAHPDVQLSSNLVLRSFPQFRQLRQRIQSGALGRLFHLEGDYNYGRVEKLTAGWRGQIPFYSVSHGGAIHLIDLIMWLSGGRISAVVAVGNQITTHGTQFKYPDIVTALLKFTDGITAKVTANFGCATPHHHCLAVHGVAGSFKHDFLGGVHYHSRDAAIPVELVNLNYDASLKGNVQRAFVSRILDGTPAEVSAADALNAMAVSLAVERSLSTNVWEPVQYARSHT